MSKDTFETLMEDFRNLVDSVDAFQKEAEAKSADLTDVEKRMFSCGFETLVDKNDDLHNLISGGF
jgi:hypothetical protein